VWTKAMCAQISKFYPVRHPPANSHRVTGTLWDAEPSMTEEGQGVGHGNYEPALFDRELTSQRFS
jgi:hypothetical protein